MKESNILFKLRFGSQHLVPKGRFIELRCDSQFIVIAVKLDKPTSKRLNLVST